MKLYTKKYSSCGLSVRLEDSLASGASATSAMRPKSGKGPESRASLGRAPASTSARTAGRSMSWDSSGRGSTGSGPYTLAAGDGEAPAGCMDTSSRHRPSRKAPSGVSTHVECGAGSWLAPGEATAGTPGRGKSGWSGPPTSASVVKERVTARSGRRRNG